ncbi:hypothetical protein A3Q56_04242 [Intoshia linei]|uniref:Cilia- and flagella-associated protein 126 n=1 Tax=Intoshia linei TaxID=1819745 RepID=A0A177B3N8_9BILA|nr:hypothetical protein A3Q56_04242 [Intoshia linei]
MSKIFDANQYENAFTAKRLQNWIANSNKSKNPSKPKLTSIISNNSGYIIKKKDRSSKSPWGKFKTTWDKPKPKVDKKEQQPNTIIMEACKDEKIPNEITTIKPKSASSIKINEEHKIKFESRVPSPDLSNEAIMNDYEKIEAESKL